MCWMSDKVYSGCNRVEAIMTFMWFSSVYFQRVYSWVESCSRQDRFRLTTASKGGSRHGRISVEPLSTIDKFGQMYNL